MRESRTSGSEGGQGREALVYPPGVVKGNKLVCFVSLRILYLRTIKKNQNNSILIYI